MGLISLKTEGGVILYFFAIYEKRQVSADHVFIVKKSQEPYKVIYFFENLQKSSLCVHQRTLVKKKIRNKNF